MALLQSLSKLFSQFGVAITILLPDSVTGYNNELLFACSLNLNDVGHAGHWLLVER